MRQIRFFVYIMASARNCTLYVGITNDLSRRVLEHKSGEVSGFTSKYNVKILVWFEEFDDPESAIAQEKRIKRWARKSKLELIEKTNPQWLDLHETMLTDG